MQVSHSLSINNETIVCNECTHELGSRNENWKNSANLNEQRIKNLNGPYSCAEQVLLRNFHCPGCGLLLDTELATPGDPFLEDILFD